jgi:hypothetical protein
MCSEIPLKHDDLQYRLDFVQRSTGDVEVVTELAGTSATGPFGDVQGNGVCSPAPLIREDEALTGR